MTCNTIWEAIVPVIQTTTIYITALDIFLTSPESKYPTVLICLAGEISGITEKESWVIHLWIHQGLGEKVWRIFV